MKNVQYWKHLLKTAMLHNSRDTIHIEYNVNIIH